MGWGAKLNLICSKFSIIENFDVAFLATNFPGILSVVTGLQLCLWLNGYSFFKVEQDTDSNMKPDERERERILFKCMYVYSIE